MQIDKIISEYVTARSTDYAIMIDGEWGSGKSWYWENTLVPMIKKMPTKDDTQDKPSRYDVATISLFGISSPDDLRLKIFEETNTFFKNKYVRTGAKLTGMVVNKLASYFNVSETKNDDIANLLSEFSVNLEHFVLCFDDLERVKPSLLIELLGYINTLVERDKIKVVFICNENELKNLDYHKYKEKIVRFTHTIKSDISLMTIEFSKERDETYKKYLCDRKDYISSVYKKGKCNNLRTLKFNLDIYEHVFTIVKSTIVSNDKSHYEIIADYMLLLSMVYSIEYRRDNNECKLRSLSEIDRQWSYQLDAIDSLERYSEKNDLYKEGSKPLVNTEHAKIVDYQKHIRRSYFANCYIYGSSEPLIDYLLTGYCNDDNLRKNIQSIENEAKRYETSEEKKLYQTIIHLWDTEDDEMAHSVARTIEKVRKQEFLLQDYPLFFLALQRLQNFGFVDLKMSQSELLDLFKTAIKGKGSSCHINNLDSYYYQSDGVETPEYKSLVNMVKEINTHYFQDNLLVEFEKVVRDTDNTCDLHQYAGAYTNLFKNIQADNFLKSFLCYKNYRKRDYWNFFNERYNYRDSFLLDEEFVNSLRECMSSYLADSSVAISGTRKYCQKLLELLDEKVKHFRIDTQ